MTGNENNEENRADASFTGLTEDEKQAYLSTVTKAFCPVCGTPVDPVTNGRPRIFCSDECRSIWKNQHRNYRNWKTARTAVCPICGKTFIAVNEKNHLRKYCSHSCANKAYWMEKRKIHPPGIDAAAGNGESGESGESRTSREPGESGDQDGDEKVNT